MLMNGCWTGAGFSGRMTIHVSHDRCGRMSCTDLRRQPMSVYLIADVEVTDDGWVPEYGPCGSARQEGSKSRFQLIDATDIAGTIPYLAKG